MYKMKGKLGKEEERNYIVDLELNKAIRLSCCYYKEANCLVR